MQLRVTAADSPFCLRSDAEDLPSGWTWLQEHLGSMSAEPTYPSRVHLQLLGMYPGQCNRVPFPLNGNDVADTELPSKTAGGRGRRGHCSAVVKELCYKPEGRRFKTR
jgi:hypothetical protein